MVALTAVHAANKSLVTSNALVAVFVGGTSGIGLNTIKALAKTHGTSKSTKSLRVYLVARNPKVGEDILSECRQLCPKGTFILIKANDLALLRDVDVACEELMEVERREAQKAGEVARIDILCMSHCIFKPGAPRLVETKEGLDTFMSQLYYSRMRFITQLLPLLLSSTLPAHIISVFGPGRDAKLIPEDLSLRSPKNYGFMSSGSHAAYFKTFFMEHLAAQYSGKLSLVHYYPGLVVHAGPADPDAALFVRTLFSYVKPLLRMLPISVPMEENGQRTLFNASSRYPAREASETKGKGTKDGLEIAESSDGIIGGGAYRGNYNNEMVAMPQQDVKLRAEGWMKKVVDHTMRAFEVIESGKVFTK
ncbi:hypothetical protein BKA65DRAFT_474195 [Rhexocercosporidium sp. MPI-PUGE-AT-0058]|nr:hypothetical protein BKA65DRAFT_474195 [Rhexocercosporidium sp. MPI-PUGE-AT-0058]